MFLFNTAFQNNIKGRRLPIILIFLFIAAIGTLIRNSGLLYFTDTISYLEMADRINKGIFPQSDSFSPGYPFLIAMFTRVFLISQIKSIYLVSLILTVCTFFVLYQLIKIFTDNSTRFSVKSFILVFIIMTNWLLLKIILTAHADLLFFFLLALYFLGLTKWLFFEEKKGFYIMLFTIAISVWIKYNAIILLPFSFFSILLYSRKKIIQHVLPLIIVLTAFVLSFVLFREINGTVIQHFQSGSFSVKIAKSIKNESLMISNFTLSGKVFFGAIFSKSAELLLPRFLATIFMFLVTFVFVYFLIVAKNSKAPENIFLFFSFFYWISFYGLCQFTGWEEINARTLFPSILTSFIWLVIQENRALNFWKHFITILIAISVVYSLCYALILNSSSKEKFLNYLSEFRNRKTVQVFNQMRNQYDFGGNVYSNDSRNLSFALDHAQVNEYPKKKVFKSGKFRNVSDSEFSINQADFWKNFSSHKSALLIFNDTPDIFIDSFLKKSPLKVYQSEKDLLIIHTD